MMHPSMSDFFFSGPALHIPDDLRKMKKALTVAEVAKLLSVSQRQVYKLVQGSEIPHFKVGKSVRFDPDLVADWLRARMDAHPILPDLGKKRR